MSNRAFALMITALAALVALLVFTHISSKIEICHAYYKEISTWSCYVSDYGLPPRNTK